MAFNPTALNAYIKRTYDSKMVDATILAREDSILRAVKKMTDGSGEDFSWLVDGDDSFNGSSDFAIAQAQAAAQSDTVGAKFRSDFFEFSAVAQISNAIIGKTKNNDGAWMQAVDVAMKKRLAGIAHYHSVLMQGYGWGEISQITSVSGSTFVPLVRSDITKYVVGMPLHFSQSLHANGLRTTTVNRVTGVNYTTGSELVTCAAAIAPGANNDWAFFAGQREDSVTPVRKCAVGLGGWFIDQTSGGTDLLDATLTSSTFYNQARTSNSRYYGTYIDASGTGSVRAALIDGVQEAAIIGGATKMELYCSKANFAAIAKDLDSSNQYHDNPTNKSIGTKRLLIYSDGTLEAHLNVSRVTNDNVIWGFDPSTVIMKSIGAAPHIDSEDGLTMARQATAAGYEIRWYEQMTIQFKNPTTGLRIKVA